MARALTPLSLDSEDFPRILALMKHCNNDALWFLPTLRWCGCPEREKFREVFTIDRRDFGRYRPAHVKRLTIIPD